MDDAAAQRRDDSMSTGSSDLGGESLPADAAAVDPDAVDPDAGPTVELDAADQDAAIETYWQLVRKRVGITRLDVVIGQGPLGAVVPPAWAFGGTPEEADALLELVLAGRKTATTSARWEYDDADAPLPAVGDLSILLDGAGRPRALISTTAVEVVALEDVTAEHAEAEGEESLERWREVHTPFLADAARVAGREPSPTMPVVLERFRLLDPRPRRADAATER
jgi:uncharacterized protein YhfF